MGYSDRHRSKPSVSRFEAFVKVLVWKLLASLGAGLCFGIFASVKFGWRFLPSMLWIAILVAILLVVAYPIWRWRHPRQTVLRNYTVIDIETTGLKPNESEITELAALRVRNGKVVRKFQELVSIRGRLPKEVSDKTHITEAMLLAARPANAVLQDFLSFIGNDALVGYNLDSFDVPFVDYHARRELGRGVANSTVDVWKLAKERKPNLASYKLDSLRLLYGISETGSHRALKDCEDTNAIYGALASLKGTVRTPSGGGRIRSHVKSIYRMSEVDLKARYGENWQIAAEIVAEKRSLVESGMAEDWDSIREGWDSSARATPAQLSMLTGLGVRQNANLSKIEASLMIDDLMLEADAKREAARRIARAQKEAEKAARAAEREQKKAEREAKQAAAQAAREERAAAIAAKKAARKAELEHFDGPRMKISAKCAARWRDEFTYIWNGILADDVIEVHELVDLKGWLSRHKRRRDDYHAMLALIDDVVADGVVDVEEPQRLYEAAVGVLDALSNDADELASQTE